jgi:hypothetical protein
MSNYGPSGGPYRDQPQDPWQGRPQEPYEQPSDPWGGQGQDPWGGAPSSTPPGGPGSPSTGYDQGYGHGYDQQSPGYDQAYGYGESTYQQQPQGYGAGPVPDPGYDAGYGQHPTQNVSSPVWNAPAPVPPPRRRGLSGGLIALLVVLGLLVVGGVGAGLMYLNRDDPGQVDNRADPGATVPADPGGGDDPSATPEPTGGAEPDARFVTKGQCVVNKGSNKQPVLRIVPCGKRTYEVLQRFDGTDDWKTTCPKVKGYQHYYFYNSEVDSLDYVLCMRLRT